MSFSKQPSAAFVRSAFRSSQGGQEGWQLNAAHRERIHRAGRAAPAAAAAPHAFRTGGAGFAEAWWDDAEGPASCPDIAEVLWQAEVGPTPGGPGGDTSGVIDVTAGDTPDDATEGLPSHPGRIPSGGDVVSDVAPSSGLHPLPSSPEVDVEALAESPALCEAVFHQAGADSLGILGGVTFGFELDCIIDEPVTRASIAHDLTNHSMNHNPFQSGGSRPTELSNRFQFYPLDYADRKRHDVWKIKPDYFHISSHSGEKVKSFQVVSPPLRSGNPNEVMHALATVFGMLRSIGARCDPTCGMHIHIDASRMPVSELNAFTERWVSVEDAVDELIPIDRSRHAVEGMESNKALVEAGHRAAAAAAAATTPWGGYHTDDPASHLLSDSMPHSSSGKGGVQPFFPSPASASAAAEVAGPPAPQNIQELVAAFNPTGRFAKVNLTNFLLPVPDYQETVEFRFHHAVMDPVAVLCCAGIAASILFDPTGSGSGRNGDTPATPARPAEGTTKKKRKKKKRGSTTATPFRNLMRMIPSAPLRAYAEVRRRDVEALHVQYIRNMMQRGVSRQALDASLGRTLVTRLLSKPSTRAALLGSGDSQGQGPSLVGPGGGERAAGGAVVAGGGGGAAPPASRVASKRDDRMQLYKHDIRGMLSCGQTVRAADGSLLSYYSGPRSVISPRDHALREAFPILTTGIIKSVDNTPSVSNAGSGLSGGIGKDSVVHYIPDDPIDPMPAAPPGQQW